MCRLGHRDAASNGAFAMRRILKAKFENAGKRSDLTALLTVLALLAAATAAKLGATTQFLHVVQSHAGRFL